MRLVFTDDDKGVLGVEATDVWLVSSRKPNGEKAANYTTIEIARTETGYVVAKESRYQGGPVRRMWKHLGGAANVRRFLGDGSLSRQALHKAGLLPDQVAGVSAASR